jgi:hypothetical protein
MNPVSLGMSLGLIGMILAHRPIESELAGLAWTLYSQGMQGLQIKASYRI